MCGGNCKCDASRQATCARAASTSAATAPGCLLGSSAVFPAIKGESVARPSGMNRQSEEGKLDYTLLRDGPMFVRWARLLTAAAPIRGRRNWQLAEGDDDLDRFRRGAARHFEQWLAGETDEDHAAALFFNVNGAEYVAERARRA